MMAVVRDTDVGIWRDDFVSTLRAIESGTACDDAGVPTGADPRV